MRKTTKIAGVALFLMIISAGCSNRFEITQTTRIDGNNTELSSAGSMTLMIAETRLATELSKKTGWHLEAHPTWHLEFPWWWSLFSNDDSLTNTIFFSQTGSSSDDSYSIGITPKSITIKTSDSQGNNKAIDRLLTLLIQEDGRYYFPVGTFRPVP